MDRAKFFAGVRAPLFHGTLTSRQVTGMEAIIDEWERCGGSAPVSQLAYVLATAHHETGASFEPVAENLNYSAAGLCTTWPARFTGASAAAYARNPIKIANRVYADRMGNGNEASGDGWRWRGRGFVQLTGRDNYARAAAELGCGEIVTNPDILTDPRRGQSLGAAIIVTGMIEGWFTGRTLANYIGPRLVDFIGARRIINGTDKADKIAGYARAFDAALSRAA